MVYVLIYLLLGMLYAGITFKSTLGAIVILGLSGADRLKIAKGSENVSDELKTSALACIVLAVLYSLFKVPFYPFLVFFDLLVRSAAKKHSK